MAPKLWTQAQGKVVVTDLVPWTSNTTAPLFYNWALDIYTSQSQCGSVAEGWSGDFGTCTCPREPTTCGFFLPPIPRGQFYFLDVKGVKGPVFSPACPRLHGCQHRPVVHHLPGGQGDGQPRGVPLLQGQRLR
jgi:hypothetical protein